MSKPTVAVVGAGITGLCAAFSLRRRGRAVSIYEAGSRSGGVIETVRRDGYLAEGGPNAVLETSPRIGRLIDDLDLGRRKLTASPAAKNRYIVRGGDLHALPTNPVAFVTSSLFSTRAKIRLMAEPFKARGSEDDESLADFVRRRLGPEFLDYAINPFVGGVYAGDPEQLSVVQAFPKLKALESEYGSLIRGAVLGASKRRRRGTQSKQSAAMVSFDLGLGVLPDRLESVLRDDLHFGARTVGCSRDASGWTVQVETEEGLVERRHSAILFAVPAYGLAGISIDGAAALEALAEVRYPAVASVILGFRRVDVQHPLDGFGMLLPRIEGHRSLGTLFNSTLFPGRAPADHVTTTTYVGGATAPELALLDRGELTGLVRRELAQLIGANGEPTFEHVAIHERAIPQYNVGYGRFRSLLTETEAREPGLFFAGHCRDGISVADSILSGFDVADRIEAARCRATD